jgi:hypothetical protein
MHEPCVVCATQISDVSGDIIVCAGPLLIVCDVNGRPLAGTHTGTQILCASMAEGDEWRDGKVIATGHVDGMVRLWKVSFWERGKQKELADAVSTGAGAGGVPDNGQLPQPAILQFLQYLYAEVPFSLRMLAMLDWHSCPVTSVHISA